ncbi:protein O-mannosyl-transferase 2-like [Gigantopelta aegis]|uniref:protein O-mannosyl-transferase 2-like n=1 Tax=Gigantopelta aegis TaxID=1735272 RepID=UPI001B88DFDE|nr:protein O-mannosyl-transferase 2-like [Gigantopelta aegis]
MAEKPRINNSLRKRKPAKTECVQKCSNSLKSGAAAGKQEHSSGEEVSTDCIPKDIGKEGGAKNVSHVDAMEPVLAVKENRVHHFCIFLFAFGSLALRLYNIDIPAHICWDETHFGKMGSWYINRTFFFDVHPPLGKMLIGLAGVLTGYDGSFPFAKPGDEYGETPYVGMRIFCALCGSMLAPLAFKIVWQLTGSIVASIMSSTLILFDVGCITLSRHILLDPILLFFIMLSTYSVLMFLSMRKRPFSVKWWGWMVFTGISLGCAVGVKFVGLFVVFLVGFTTVFDLWNLLGDRGLTMFDIMKHFMARAVCLILVPIVCYMLFFAVHFRVLKNSGNGDGFYSSAFQSQLVGNKLYNVSMPENIAFGSTISLKQRRTGGAYLHSHWHLYPEEHPPKQQQITTYSHKDHNNLWKIKPADQDASTSDKQVQLVKSGDLVRLEHIVTKRNLHSHREPAPLSKKHFQVSGYGQNGTGDTNDIWLVEIISASPGTPIQTVRSKLKLTHYYVRCVLFSHDKKLPKWGWEQLEATCNPNTRDKNAMWSVEEVIDHRLPNVSFEVYSPSFLEKLIESHAVMTQGNSGLKPKEGEITSRPWQWPIDYRGQIFSGKDHRIYLLGNPVIFWLLLVTKGLFLVCFAVHSFLRKRQVAVPKPLLCYNQRMFHACWFLMLGWALHYLPFWTMSRVLYFHHYFPAFLYSAMLGGIMLDYLITRLCLVLPESIAIKVFPWCLGIIVLGVTYSFYLFHPLTFGMSGPMANDETSMMHGLKWMESWDI